MLKGYINTSKLPSEEQDNQAVQGSEELILQENQASDTFTASHHGIGRNSFQKNKKQSFTKPNLNKNNILQVNS